MMKNYSPSFWLRNKYASVRKIYLNSAFHFNLSAGLGLLGLVSALFKDYSVYETSYNFIAGIKFGGFNHAGFVFMLLLFSTLLYFVAFLTCRRYVAFLIFGYGGIFFGSFFLWRFVFIATAVSGLYGTLLLVFFILPVFIVNFCLFSIALAKIYELCGYSYHRRLTCSIACHFGLIFKGIKIYWFVALVFNLLLWFLLFLIFSLIF